MFWAKTERDAFGEWTLRTQTGAIVAAVGAVVILLSHYPYVLNAVAAVLGILGIYELLHALNQCTTPKMFILSLTALLICFGTIPYYPIKKERNTPYEKRNKKSNAIVGNCDCCNSRSICHRLSDNTASDKRGFGSGRTQSVSKSGQSDFRHLIRQCVSGGIAKSG